MRIGLMIRRVLLWWTKGDLELAHEYALWFLELLEQFSILGDIVAQYAQVKNPMLKMEVWGIQFPNPVGLAAGFDKNATAMDGLSLLGFGHIVAGTVTCLPQKPNDYYLRLVALEKDAAIINCLGFPNDGAEVIAARLESVGTSVVVGVSIGKSRNTPLDQCRREYRELLNEMYPYVSYIEVNVSSPNTEGLRKLLDKKYLNQLLRAIINDRNVIARRTNSSPKPVLLKVSPDMTEEQLDDVAITCLQVRIDGIVAVNTTVQRQGLNIKSYYPSVQEGFPGGGLSGPPLRNMALERVRRLYELTAGKIPIIGVGGITTAEDAYAMVRAGASLIQLFTSFTRDPFIARKINLGIIELLKQDGLKNLRDAVGLDHRMKGECHGHCRQYS